MTPLPEYSHVPGIGFPLPMLPGQMFGNRKFRWVARLFKNKEEIKRANFVKIHNRPDYQPSREPPHLPDLDYFFDWGFSYYVDKPSKEGDWTEADLKNFDEVVLALFDGCGCMLERWTIGDITMKPWHGVRLNDAMSEDDYDVYEVTFNCCLHNYESLCDRGVNESFIAKYEAMFGPPLTKTELVL
jgi:hypothetical protein